MDKPEEVVIHIDYLTGNEILAIEDLADAPFDAMWDRKAKKARLLIAAATVIKRRDDPEFTFERAGEMAIRVAWPGEEPDDPTVPGEPSGSDS